MNGKSKKKNETLKCNCFLRLCKTICVSLILSFSFLIPHSAQAQVKWHTPEEASTAKIGNRLFFFDFYTNWCGYCKKMDRETFSDPTVAAIMNKYYYPVKFNAEGSEVVNSNGTAKTTVPRKAHVATSTPSPSPPSADRWDSPPSHSSTATGG